MNQTAPGSGPQKLTHFRELGLENWRNFQRLEVGLQDRVFLVGPNAAGKSNLLDVFRFLHDIAGVGGGLQTAVGRRGGVSRLRCLAARRYPDVAVTVRVGGGHSDREWTYELRFGQDNRQRPIVKAERVALGHDVILQRPNEQDEADPERLTQTYLEQVNANQSFRQLVEFFSSIRYLHIVPQLIREPDRSVGRREDPFGGDFLERLAATPAKTLAARLRRIQSALQVAVPQLREIELRRDDRGVPHLRGRYEHWRPQGAWQGEEQFSDGTLRLMGLLWAIMDGSGPLLLEEPELSLHAEVVRHVPQMLARTQRRSGRQVLMSTHSPDLLDDEGVGLDEVLLLKPEGEGTIVSIAAQAPDIDSLLRGGSRLSEVVIPLTQPARVHQLTLFGE